MRAEEHQERPDQGLSGEAFRVTLAEALRLLTDANEIQATAARMLGEHLGASRVIYAEVLPGGKDVIVHKSYTNGVVELSGQYRLDAFGRHLAADHRAGQTAIVPDVANSLKYTDSEKARYRALDIAAHLDVPLVKKEQCVALLAVHQATPRVWTEREVQWVEETAEQTWTTVERARVEAALRESEAKYRTLFESIDEGLLHH
jgi:GAF domain-containing protein